MNDHTQSSTLVEAPPITTMDILQIRDILPHRYPFLLIDRIVEIERKVRIAAIKNVTVNEPFFQGHFPSNPIMPGVLLVESIAQTGGVLFLIEIPDRDNRLMVLTGVEEAKFRLPVVPGDQLRIDVDLLKWRAMSVKGKEMIAVKAGGKVTVEGKLACEATINCQLIMRPTQSDTVSQKNGAE